MENENKTINLGHVRATLRAVALTCRGDEYEARQAVAVLMREMRAEGYTYAQVAHAFGAAGPNVGAEVRPMMRDLISESLSELIRTADERDLRCSQCPLREVSGSNATSVGREV